MSRNEGGRKAGKAKAAPAAKRRRAAAKSTGESTGRKKRAVGELIPQPHGGALRNGGTNVGGSGRPPSIIREQLRGSFADRVAWLETVVDGEAVVTMKGPDGTVTVATVSADMADRLRAMDMLAKYGLGTTKEVSVEDVRGRLSATLDAIRVALPVDDAERVIAAIKPLWS